MKNAQGLSLTTIVIAAIVLIILVVLIIIFGGGMGRFTGSVKSCVSAGGEPGCYNDCDELIDEKNYYTGTLFVNIPGTECEDQEQKCCNPIYKAPKPSKAEEPEEGG